MAATLKLAESLRRSHPTAARFYSTARLLSSASSSPSITQQPDIPAVRCSPQPSFLISHSPLPSSSPYGINPARFNPARLRVNRSGNPPYNPGSSDRPPTEMAPLFPGCDYEHWLIVMDKPGGEGAAKQQMIDCYIQTLAKVLGSEEEAKKKIYNVSCERYFGFGCEVDEETANKMEGLPGVLFVLPDSYVDPEYKDYGAELFVNGEIVQRSPERQRRVEPVPQRDRVRPNTRYNRRRDMR
ncbi:PREDICTED: multiple organellar RNA editing factor 2, chloroplastic-like [Ipomoea nil]|uniref:multiple organellar RNA editing factor 2, chloroplastic-like n=1 Tax=Ipomoea nil TaxID=35883 RepID=UPI000900DA9D|nr:PREDICTED: multiple organellar RNA editing factor 2, chloroplastic-like [Ipomoea nil]